MKSPVNRPAAAATSELAELVQRIDHLKQEHGPLLSKIQGDQGMGAPLREELLRHLQEEEAEIIAKMAAISPEVAARYRPSAPSGRASEASSEPSRLTVGSLRDGRGGAPGSRHLRPQTPASAPSPEQPMAPTRGGRRLARLSVGSLRRW